MSNAEMIVFLKRHAAVSARLSPMLAESIWPVIDALEERARDVAAERERCAKIAEEWGSGDGRSYIHDICARIAAKIRSVSPNPNVGSPNSGADPVNVRDDYFPHGALYYPKKYWELVDGEVRRIRSGE